MRSACLAAGLLIILSLVQPANAQQSPEKALSTFTVADGLQVELFAAEPMFINPTCMDVDHKGRVWVCEAVNYRSKLRQEDRSFAPKATASSSSKTPTATARPTRRRRLLPGPGAVLAPLGIAVAKDPDGTGYKVFVCQSPRHPRLRGQGRRRQGRRPAEEVPHRLRRLRPRPRRPRHHHRPRRQALLHRRRRGREGPASRSDGKGREVDSRTRTDCRAGTVWRCDTGRQRTSN